jgi:hypothetical protein
MSRAQQTSTVEQNTGGAVAPFLAGKNKVINGDFGIWQRGTSFSNPSSLAYTADRWAIYYDGSGATRTISQQAFTTGAAPVTGYESSFFYRYAVSVAGSGNTANLLRQYIENVRNFAGQTATVSFWAKASASITVPSVGTTQNFGTGGSPSAGVDTGFATNIAVTTSWQRFSFTANIPSISSKTLGTNNDTSLELRFFLPAGSSTFTFDIWGVQLEAGSVATPFTTASNTLQGELALCQRYYQRVNNNPSGYGGYGLGSASTTTNVRIDYFFPVQMRTLPSAIDYSTLSSTYAVFDGQNLLIPTAITYNSNESYVNQIHLDLTVSGAVQYRPYKGIFQGSSSGYLGFSAEL